MAGLLTVVNPRRRRRRKAARARTRRARPAKRRRRVARAHNPIRRVRRRRVHARRRAHRNPHRRRRHHNPIAMGGVVGTLTKGLALGGGAIATNVATAGVIHLLGTSGAAIATGPGKIALKGAVGLIALPMLLKFVPGAGKYANHVRLGAGIAIAIDLYEQYVKAHLPVYLQDYQYGSLNAYQYGSLQGWAPQEGVSGDSANTYDGGVYS